MSDYRQGTLGPLNRRVGEPLARQEAREQREQGVRQAAAAGVAQLQGLQQLLGALVHGGEGADAAPAVSPRT